VHYSCRELRLAAALVTGLDTCYHSDVNFVMRVLTGTFSALPFSCIIVIHDSHTFAIIHIFKDCSLEPKTWNHNKTISIENNKLC